MIYPYLRKEDILPILDRIKDLRPKDYDKVKSKISDLNYINDQFVCVSRDKGIIDGFMFATIESFDMQLCIFIQYCFADKNGIAQQMLDNVTEWSKERDIYNLIFLSERNSKSWERKYKFKEIYKVLKRSIR